MPTENAVLRYFYPRSPCGERRAKATQHIDAIRISIHALLAESDLFPAGGSVLGILFLSTLSLRRATGRDSGASAGPTISIHALLAESDFALALNLAHTGNFYPRSPCGERRKSNKLAGQKLVFLSTLSLRRATWLHPRERR